MGEVGADAHGVNDGLGTTTDATALMELLEDLVIEGWRDVGGGKPLAAISSAGVGEDGVCAGDSMQSLGLVIAWHRQAGNGGGGAVPRALATSPASTSIRRRASGCGCASTAPPRSAARKTWITLTDYAGLTLVRRALHERDARRAHRLL